MMRKNRNVFQKKLLAVAVLGMTTQAFAQSEEASIETIEVKGLRSSLMASQAVKRDAVGIVDAISAEDMGKFPDTNLAESLQRITGVSISRENGEGSKITVRGMGEDYNMVTLNGRTLPAADAPRYGAANSRAFDFANLASESVNGVEVYKTGKANIATGGIGATVNILTARPLNNPGTHGSVAVKAVHDTTNITGDDVTPELSGIFSWTDDNEKFGVGLAASHQIRHSGSIGAETSRWETLLWDGSNPTYTNTEITNEPNDGDLFAVPTGVRYQRNDRERTRTNAQLVLQARPIDSLTATLDYTYAENKTLEERKQLGVWFLQTPDKIIFEENHEGIHTPILYSEKISKGITDIVHSSMHRQQASELKSLGLNLDFQVNDDLNLTLDVHSSSAEATPDSSYGGSSVTVGYGANAVEGQSVDFSTDLPTFEIDFNDCGHGLNCNGEFDKGDVGSTVMQIFVSYQKTDIDQVKLDGEWYFEGLSFVDSSLLEFGVESRTVTNHMVESSTYNPMGDWGIAHPGDIPADILTPTSFNDDFDDYSSGDSWNQGFHGNAEAIGEWAAAESQKEDSLFKNAFNFKANKNWSDDRTVEEEINAAYVQAKFQFYTFDLPANLTTGLRYEETTVTSTNELVLPEYISWKANNDFYVEQSSEVEPFSRSADYDYLLPNIDLDVELTDDVKARASYSKTIARATYGNLSSSIKVHGMSRITEGGRTNATAAAGNPGLLPYESNNFDLSLEWYYDSTSYMSIGYYEKHIDNFIGLTSEPQNHFDLRDPTAGPRAQAARDALAARDDHDGVIDETELFTMVVAMENGLDYDTLDPSTAENDYDVNPNQDDPLIDFTTTFAINNKSARLWGFELAAQHFFGDSGFGVQTNYTTVNANVSYDNTTAFSNQFAVGGLSDTFNLVAMYEKDGITARIAYNWRDDYMSSGNYSNNNPAYTEDYSQIDMNVSYDVNESLQLFFEGLNLTGENTRTHTRTRSQFLSLEDLGARYQVGARYQF